jgi:hypothetical protein
MAIPPHQMQWDFLHTKYNYEIAMAIFNYILAFPLPPCLSLLTEIKMELLLH